jgi:hypothetical protein
MPAIPAAIRSLGELSMTNSAWRRSVLAMASILAGALLHVSGSGAAGQNPQSPAFGITGTWEKASTNDLGPGVFRLNADGNTLTGLVWDDGGLVGPAEIFDGRINGATFSFKYRSLPGGSVQELTVTLTGKLRKDEIAFTSQLESDVAKAHVSPVRCAEPFERTGNTHLHLDQRTVIGAFNRETRCPEGWVIP